MIYKLPVRLEDGQTFTSLPPTNLSFPKTSGYDGDNLRVTNIVGIQNGDFLKNALNVEEQNVQNNLVLEQL